MVMDVRSATGPVLQFSGCDAGPDAGAATEARLSAALSERLFEAFVAVLERHQFLGPKRPRRQQTITHGHPDEFSELAVRQVVAELAGQAEATGATSRILVLPAPIMKYLVQTVPGVRVGIVGERRMASGNRHGQNSDAQGPEKSAATNVIHDRQDYHYLRGVKMAGRWSFQGTEFKVSGGHRAGRLRSEPAIPRQPRRNDP